MLSCVQDFVCLYMHFMEQSRDFDQRLATVLNQAFQDSKNLNSTFKVCIFMETECSQRHHLQHICSFLTYQIQKAASDVFLSSLTSAGSKEHIWKHGVLLSFSCYRFSALCWRDPGFISSLPPTTMCCWQCSARKLTSVRLYLIITKLG